MWPESAEQPTVARGPRQYKTAMRMTMLIPVVSPTPVPPYQELWEISEVNLP